MIIFCSDPLKPRRIDPSYQAEAMAAHQLGFPSGLISFEMLVYEEDARTAIRQVAAPASPTLAFYRGWMLTPHQYRMLFAALQERNIVLINDPAAYQYAHYFPEAYDAIKDHTPASVWLRANAGVDIEHVMSVLRPFGGRPVLVKDFVKSRKHEWAEACYIPSASDRQAVAAIVRRFLQLQGPDLAEGLVFREFVELEPLTMHSRSGMPLALEYRIFYLDGEPLYVSPYWAEGDYPVARPPRDLFAHVARTIRSRFFTMDVARRRSGEWVIIELGDGQVAGLSESANIQEFYSALSDRWPHR